MTFPSATLAGRYALHEPIARGGMATVWRAHDDVLARDVAVKVLHPHLAEDEAFLERFRREALAAARLTHPNIVAIYDTGVEASDSGPQHYIVMEYCGRGTLADLARAEGPLAPERVMRIGATICDALAYAHAHGVVHRDIKPANVLIANDGTLKVADFGIAKAAFASREVTTTGSIIGTVTYISPEQTQGEEPTACSDIYSLGIVLYELLLGRVPFSGETQIATAMAHVNQRPAPPRSIRPDVPRGVEGIVLRALAKQPKDRFGDANQMRVALEDAAGGRATTSHREMTPVGRAPSSGGEWRWIGWVALIAIAVLLGSLVLAGRDDGGGDDQPGEGPGGGGTAERLDVVDVRDFDPAGDEEHPEEAPLAVDGDTSTSWSTESYSDPLSAQKPGVGLVLEVGDPEVGRVDVLGEAGTVLELRSGACGGDTHEAFEVRADGTIPPNGKLRLELEEPAGGPCWVVWITELPGGTGSTSIAEALFFGS